MNNRLSVSYEDKPAYEILLEPDFKKLPLEIEALGMLDRRFMIITDSNAGKHYANELFQLLAPFARSIQIHTFPAGEQSKNLDTVSQCYEQLIIDGFDRKDVLIALGGGVVGDLTGFVASTYLRGIRFIQVPTTLLSMVDSSIGGKTGVDYKAYKNMVGAFHQPSLVYMNLATLDSLPEREFLSGMAEIIKHGLIKDLEYYSWLKEHSGKIHQKDYETLQEMVYHSCQIKGAVVEKDPKEQGERALLNFGHTIGHSVEKLMDFQLLHGECVCIGMAAAAYMSMKRGNITQEEYQDILATLGQFKQPVHASGLSAEEVYEVTRSDKKMDSDKIRFILLGAIGDAVIDPSVSKDEMIEAIQTIL
ncbi:MAG TPA: 3-dehydroquinate synthase [Clostridiales bacterium]|nr:3-dehydroquinate synthase [Clostridiales bacterium]